VPIKEIMRRLGYSRGLVRKVIRGLRSDVFRTRESTLDRYLSMLDEEWNGGCRNGAELWRRLKARGFAGSLRVVTEWATRRRRAEQATGQHVRKVPSARTCRGTRLQNAFTPTTLKIIATASIVLAAV
jgi:transposase